MSFPLNDWFRGQVFDIGRYGVCIEHIQGLVDRLEAVVYFRADPREFEGAPRRGTIIVDDRWGKNTIERNILRQLGARIHHFEVTEPDCCVAHILLGQYDGTPCVVTRKDARELASAGRI